MSFASVVLIITETEGFCKCVVILKIELQNKLFGTQILFDMKNGIKSLGKLNYTQLIRLGSAFNLSFSNQEILSNKIIGLDEKKRKLLVAEKNNELSPPYIIELAKVTAITVKKIYNSIKAGELKTRGIKEFLESLLLQFQYGNEKDPIVLPFYERKINEIHDLPRLEKKARNWQMILSKVATAQKNGPPASTSI
jgi:hypothetical protein